MTGPPIGAGGLPERLGLPANLIGNVLKLAFGSLAARVISLAAVPVLTRIYAPVEMGLLAQFVATVLLVSPLLALRFPVALPLPGGDRAASALVGLSLCLTGIMTGLLAVLVALGDKEFFNATGLGVLYPWRWILLAAILGTALYELFQFWAIRRQHMAAVARTQIVQSLAGNGAKLSFGFADFGAAGLIVGQLVQQSAGSLSLLRQFLLDITQVRTMFRMRRMRAAASRYSKFPMLRLPSQFLLVLGSQIPVLVVARLFGDATTGQLSLAVTVLAVPVGILTQAIGNAFYSEIARVWNHAPEQVGLLTLRVSIRLLLVAIVPSGAVLSFGPPLFAFLFGEEWRLAGTFAQVLSVALLAQITTAPVMHILTVMQRHGMFLLLNVIRVALIGTAFGLAIAGESGATDTIALYSAALTAYYVSVAFIVTMIVQWRIMR